MTKTPSAMLFSIVALLMSKYLCTFSASAVAFLFVSIVFMVYQHPEIFNTQKKQQPLSARRLIRIAAGGGVLEGDVPTLPCSGTALSDKPPSPNLDISTVSV